MLTFSALTCTNSCQHGPSGINNEFPNTGVILALFATSSLDRVTPPLSHIAKQVNVRSLLVPTVELNTTATTFLRSTSLMMITRPAERDFMAAGCDSTTP